MIREHVQAVVNLLTAQGLTAYRAKVPSLPQMPYVVVYRSGPQVSSVTLANDNAWRDWDVQTTSVGLDDDQVAWVQERVHTALLGVRPAVGGRVCDPIEHDHGEVIRRDDEVDPALFYAVDTWHFVSLPA